MTNPNVPQHGYTPPPPPGHAPPPPGRTNPLALAAFILALTSLSCGITAPVGAILGHVARSQIRQRGESGAGMAKAAIIIGWIGTALIVLFIALGVAGVFDTSS
jgi:hypothetical protein